MSPEELFEKLRIKILYDMSALNKSDNKPKSNIINYIQDIKEEWERSAINRYLRDN